MLPRVVFWLLPPICRMLLRVVVEPDGEDGLSPAAYSRRLSSAGRVAGSVVGVVAHAVAGRSASVAGRPAAGAVAVRAAESAVRVAACAARPDASACRVPA